jgi:hypothetical protein
VVVNPQGKIVEELTFEHTAEGWMKWKQLLKNYPHLAVAIETSQGAAIEQLLESGVIVYPVNPKVRSAIGREKPPAEPRLITWTPGVWVMRCELTAMAGEP